MIAERIGDIAGQARHSDEAYTAFASVGDGQGLADALRERGKTASARGDAVRGNAIYTELAELAERIRDLWNGAIALGDQETSRSRSATGSAWSSSAAEVALRRELGDEWGMALALCNIAFAELQLGGLSSAASSLRVAAREHEDRREDGRARASTSPSSLRSRGGRSTRQRVSSGAASRLHEARLGPGVSRGRLVRARRQIHFASRSAPTRTPSSAAGGSCRSTRRQRCSPLPATTSRLR